MRVKSIPSVSALVVLLLAQSLTARPLLRFDQPIYRVAEPGSPLEVSILLDGDHLRPDDQVLKPGLFSYALQVAFDPEKAKAARDPAAQVPDQLDFFGLDQGAFQRQEAGSVAVKGNISPISEPVAPYHGTVLARFSLQNLAPHGDQYDLSLSLFRTLGLNEQLFLDGDGKSLDADLLLGTARVTVGEDVVPGDFDGDGQLTAEDIDLLCKAAREQADAGAFDLNQDGQVDRSDLRIWVKDLKRTYFGDANLDAEFSSSDLIQVFQRGEYEDRFSGNSGWADGDWNCDADFTSTDLIVAFQDGGFEKGPVGGATATVPEPSGVCLILLASVALLRSGRRQRLPHG